MSRVNISKLNIQITASSEGLRTGVNGANQELKRIEDQSSKSADMLKGLGLAFGIVAAASAATLYAGKRFWNFLRDIQGELDKTIKEANRLGTTFSELSGLRFAAGELAGQADAIDDAIREMQLRASRAIEGDEKIQQAFNRLGVRAGDLLAAGPLDSIMQIADGLKDISSQGERLRIAQELLGRSGSKVVAALQGGSDAIREALEFHQRWNSLTDAQAIGIEKNNDAWGRVALIVEGMTNTLAAEAAPLMQTFADELIAAAGSAEDLRGYVRDFVNLLAFGVGFAKGIGAALRDPFSFDPAAIVNEGMRAVFDLNQRREELEQAASDRAERRERDRVESLAELQRRRAEEAQAALKRDAESLAETLRKQYATPFEKLETKIQDIAFALVEGGLEFEVAMRGVGDEVDRIANQIKQMQQTPDIGPTLRGSAEDAAAQARRDNQARMPQDDVRQQLQQVADMMLRREREIAEMLKVPEVNERAEKIAQENVKQTKDVASTLRSNHLAESGLLRSIDSGIQQLTRKPDLKIVAVGL